MDLVVYTKQTIQTFLKSQLKTKTYLDLLQGITNEKVVSEEEKKAGVQGTTEEEKKQKTKIVMDIYSYFTKNKNRLQAHGVDENTPPENVYKDYSRLKSMEPEGLAKRIIQQFKQKKDYKQIHDSLKELNGKSHIISEEDTFNGESGITISDKHKKDKLIERVYSYFLNRGYKLTGEETVDFLYQDFRAFELEEEKRELKQNGTTLDMSYLYREDFLAKATEKGKIKRLVGAMNTADNDTREYISYVDSSGKQIKIKMLNTLLYKTPNGIVKSINKYSVVYGDEDKSYDVYSSIDTIQMESNEEYRKAVLGSLLRKENVLLSNAEGYIGSIEPQKGEFGTEDKTSNLSYSFQVSQNYALRYDAEDLSAVVAYSRGLNKLHDDTPTKEGMGVKEGTLENPQSIRKIEEETSNLGEMK